MFVESFVSVSEQVSILYSETVGSYIIANLARLYKKFVNLAMTPQQSSLLIRLIERKITLCACPDIHECCAMNFWYLLDSNSAQKPGA